MKIACVSYYLPPVDPIGSGVQMHYTANAYARHGHEVTMFSPYSQEQRAGDARYDMVQVPVGTKNRVVQFAWNLRKQDFSQFDLLHTSGDDHWLLGVPRPYHIRTFHGSCFAEAAHTKKLAGRFRMFCLGLTELAACAVADRKVCVSKDTRKYIPWAKEVIWNGVDLSIFNPGPAPVKKSDAPSILFIGMLDSRKRGRALLEIFEKQVRSEIPNAELWVVRERVEEPVEGVQWLHYVTLEKLVELYRSAWVFCLPSSYEGFGVPYIEAMACGTAVVASPNVGAMEVLDAGRFGAIADLPDLGKTLIRLLKDDAERKRMEALGLQRAQEFAWEAVIAKYLKQPEQRPRRPRIAGNFIAGMP